ncbi:MAG: tetratricopeptide repeat protein [Bacteroidota bacterium]
MAFHYPNIRNLTMLLVLSLTMVSLPLSAQVWERLGQEFSKHIEQQEFQKAAELAVKQVNYAVEELDSTDTRYMMSYYNLALATYGMEAWEEAKSHLGVAYNLLVPFYTNHGAELARVCELYGRIETQLGMHESAENFLFYARDVNAAVYGKESYAYIRTLYYIADLEMAKADWEQMVTVLVEALEIHEQHFQKNQDFARYANFLGLIYLNNGGNREAAETFKWALEAFDEPGIEKNFTYAHASNNLGLALYYQSDFEHAALHFEQADSIYRILLEGYSENYMMLLNNLASLYYSWGKPELAGEAFRQMEDYLMKYPGPRDLNYILAVENVASYHAEEAEYVRTLIMGVVSSLRF